MSICKSLYSAVLLALSMVFPAQAETDDWYLLNYNALSIVPDLSFLNEAPAGLRGRVVQDGPNLAFEDGTPVRFWGANIQASALFETRPPAMTAHARRLALLGFNLVRIHHHDSHWVTPNIFEDQRVSTANLNENSLRLLDRWIEALKAEGIYVWLDIHVGRRMVRGDQIDHFDEIADKDGFANVKGFNYVSTSIQERMLDFQRKYVSHVNHVSGLRYADDPAIVAMLISNENDLTHHFGNRLLPDKNVPEHTALYLSEANKFADLHGLERDKVWRSWEHGPTKIFLNDLEYRFYARFSEDLRALGYEGFVVPSNFWGGMSISGLPSLSAWPLIDTHSYEGPDELFRDPNAGAGSLATIAIAQVAGLPLAISEWNVDQWDQEDRFVLPLRMATLSAHQGWDAPMIYGYAQQSLSGPQRPRSWSVAGDPAIMATMPASALLYRKGHVGHAAKTYALRLTPEQFFGGAVSPNNSAFIRTIVEQSALTVEIPAVKELAWLEPRKAADDAIVVEDINLSVLPQGTHEIEADTGDFKRDFEKGLFSIDTDRTQLVAGNLAGSAISLPNMRLETDRQMAVVAVQSLDDEPISQSLDLLVTITARKQPNGTPRPIYRVETNSGLLTIAAQPGLKVTDLKGKTVPYETVADGYAIDLDKVAAETWLRLRP